MKEGRWNRSDRWRSSAAGVFCRDACIFLSAEEIPPGIEKNRPFLSAEACFEVRSAVAACLFLRDKT